MDTKDLELHYTQLLPELPTELCEWVDLKDVGTETFPEGLFSKLVYRIEDTTVFYKTIAAAEEHLQDKEHLQDIREWIHNSNVLGEFLSHFEPCKEHLYIKFKLRPGPTDEFGCDWIRIIIYISVSKLPTGRQRVIRGLHCDPKYKPRPRGFDRSPWGDNREKLRINRLDRTDRQPFEEDYIYQVLDEFGYPVSDDDTNPFVDDSPPQVYNKSGRPLPDEDSHSY